MKTETQKKRIVVIEGEDAAPATVQSTVSLIDKFNLNIEWMYPLVGHDALKSHY